MKNLFFLMCFMLVGFMGAQAFGPMSKTKKNPSNVAIEQKKALYIESEPIYVYGQISKIIVENGDVLYPCKKRNLICSKKTPCPTISMECPVSGGARIDLFFAEGVETIMAHDFIIFGQGVDEETGEIYNIYKIIY